jgi:hypothetical protein
MKYILLMNGKKSDFEGYARWSKEDLQANVAFMRAFSKELKDSGVFVASEGLGWPNEAKLVRGQPGGAHHGWGISGIQRVPGWILDR